jgi:SPASM domain peptide maturase of grasp-with-spasm system
MNDYFILYSSNVVVDGKYRSAIYDLSKRQIYLIPLTFSKVIREFEKYSYEQVRENYSHQSDIFNSYISYLIDRNLGFISNDRVLFSKLNLEYQTPEIINTATVEYSFSFSLELLVSQLNECNCKNILLYIKSPIKSLEAIKHLLNKFSNSTLRTITLVFDTLYLLPEDQLKELFEFHKKLYTLLICRAHRNEIVNVYQNKVIYLIESMTNIMKYELKDYLIINFDYFFESQRFNPYYNRKVSIDELGNIKNSIYKKKAFGNISDSNLYKIVSGGKFQKLWKRIPPQMKDSEFRYCLYNPSKKLEESRFTNCKIIELND